MNDSQMDRCRGEGFIPLPKVVRADRTHVYCECPFCDSSDHLASIAIGCGLHDARPVHCHLSGRMAWVLFISGVLEAEEVKFRALVSRFDGAKQMDAEAACTAWHSRGLPYEMAEELSDDPKRFRELADAHRAKSGERLKTVY